MALSEYERDVLAQMEEQFRDADPEWVERLGAAQRSTPAPVRIAPRVWAAMVCLLLVGVVLLVVGVVINVPVVGVLVSVAGFCAMVAGVSLPLMKMAGHAKRRRDTHARAGEGFMDRQKRQWERRTR